MKVVIAEELGGEEVAVGGTKLSESRNEDLDLRRYRGRAFTWRRRRNKKDRAIKKGNLCRPQSWT